MRNVPNLIDKSDFNEYVKLSMNVDDVDIDIFIKDAIQFHLPNRIPTTLFNAIVLIVKKYDVWDDEKVFAVDDLCIHNDRLFKSKTAANENHVPVSDLDVVDSTNWTEIELWSYWRNFIRPFLVYYSYSNFYAEHGLDITSAGAKKTRGDKTENVSDSERAMVVRNNASKANVVFANFMRTLSDAQFKIDGVTYSFTESNVVTTKSKIKIRISD